MNIIEISTLYPENKNNLRKDTNALKYFIDDWVKMGNKVLVLHPYRIPIADCFKALFDRSRFSVYHTSDEAVEVFMTQTQLFIPHNYIPTEWQQRIVARKFAKAIGAISPPFLADVVSVSFPLTNLRLCEILAEGYPSMCVLHKSDICTLEKMDERKRKHTIDRLNKCFRVIGVRSDAMKRRGIQIGVLNQGSPVIYSGIDSELIYEKKCVKEKSTRISKLLKVVFAGSLVAQKNIATIIEGIAIARKRIDVSLEIIGDGSEAGKLKNLCSNLKIEDIVKFTGRLERLEVVNHMREADVFVMLSVNETFGLVYLEALAQGCIVIATKDDGIDGVICDHYNGFLIEPNRPELLAEKLEEIFRLGSEDKAAIVNRGYETATSMTNKMMSERYFNELQKCVRGE